jgi:hypothetical protein
MRKNMKYFGRQMTLLIAAVLICAAVFGAGKTPVAVAAPPPIVLPDPETEPTEDPEEPPSPLSPVELAIKDAPDTMKVGGEATLSYTLKNASETDVLEWTSSNSEVASVDAEGKVRAISPGNVEITAFVGEVRTSVLITVDEISAESVKIAVREFSPADMLLSPHELTVGDTLHLTAKITPENARVGDLTWSVSDKDAVAVDKDGLLTAKEEGDVVVTLTAGDLTDSLSFTVKKQSGGLPLIPIIAGAALLVVLAAVAILLILLRRKKRREAERKEREAAKQKREARREKSRSRERERPDGGKKLINRSTLVFNPDPEGIDRFARDDSPEAYDERDANAGKRDADFFSDEGVADEPDRPFSIDDIE